MMKRFLVVLLAAALFTGQAEALPFRGGGTTSVSGTVSEAAFAADRIFQRVGSAKTVTFAGTYTGNPDAIDVQIIDASNSTVLVPWATIQSLPTGGAFSGTLSVPQYDGWMKWQARIHGVGAPSVVTSSRQFGVGALILLTGQSNLAGLWAWTSGSPATPNANTRRYAGNGWFAVNAAQQTGEVNFQFGNGVQGGDGIAQFVNLMHTQLGVNVGVLEYAVSGTHSERWAQGGDMYIQTVGPGSVAPFGITYADVGSDCELDIHGQGEGDASAGNSSSYWLTNAQSFYNGIKGVTRNSLPIGVQLLGWANGYTGVTDSRWTAIKSAQLQFVANNSSAAWISDATTDMQLKTDGIHLVPASNGQNRAANRQVQSYANYLGLTTYGMNGPVVSSIKWATGTPTKITFNITPSTGFSIIDGAGGTGTSLNGFRVFDNGVAQTISSTVISGNSVVLTLSSALSSTDVNAGLVTADYEYGETPHGTSNPPTLANFVFDNSTPQGDTLGLPLLATNGLITVTQ